MRQKYRLLRIISYLSQVAASSSQCGFAPFDLSLILLEGLRGPRILLLEKMFVFGPQAVL